MTPVPLDDPAALTRYIESRFHARHRRDLPGLVALAIEVEAEHFGDHNVPRGLTEVLGDMADDMEEHMRTEEQILFPMIRRAVRPGAGHPIPEMRADHQDHTREITYIRALTNDFKPPKGADQAWTALYAGLRQFIAELREHIRLEDDVLFPQFDAQH